MIKSPSFLNFSFWLSCFLLSFAVFSNVAWATCTSEDFDKAMAESENSGNPDWNSCTTANNGTKYCGKYQMSQEEYQKWGNGNYPPSASDQDYAFHNYMNSIDQQLQKSGAYQYVGQSIGGVMVTKSGLMAMAHLGGVGGTMKFLKSNGSYNPGDGPNAKSQACKAARDSGMGVSEREKMHMKCGSYLSDYGNKFAGYGDGSEGCNKNAANNAGPMCDPNIRARVAEQVQMAVTQKADFMTTMATMPRPVSEVANTPCVSNELQRIANQFAYAPTMYSANILGQLSGLAGPVSGLMNNMFGSLFQSVTKAANLNPLAQQFNNFASNTLGSLLSSLGLGGPFSSALCGMMVDMVLKYVQCAAPIKLPDLGNLTGSLNNLLGNDCIGSALKSTLYSSAAQSAMKNLAQPITVPATGVFSSAPLTLGTAPGQELDD